MIERSLEEIPTDTRFGVIGHCSCRFRCPGCPASAAQDALTLRIVGYDGETLPLIRALAPRSVELASGELPVDKRAFSDLKDAGLRRIVTPLFGPKERHDERAGRPGTFDEILSAIAAARGAGLAIRLAAVGSAFSTEEARDMTRLSWANRAELAWVNSSSPPCFAWKME